jgi:4-hydroxy-4-methyl-2-oxoglutarate aldolase
VFATMVALRGATKEHPGTNGSPVQVGDAPVALGDWIVADADGVVVIPSGHLNEVLTAGRARADKEEGLFAALRGGKTTVELLQLDTSPIVEG